MSLHKDRELAECAHCGLIFRLEPGHEDDTKPLCDTIPENDLTSRIETCKRPADG